MKTRFYFLLAVLALRLAAQTTNGAPVSGALTGTDKKAIANAYVILSVIPAAPPAVTQPYHSITRTATDGKFRFDNVPAGDFRVCIQAPGTKLLNPCDWLDRVPTVHVVGRAAVDAGTLEIPEGYLLEVNLTDSQGLIALSKRRAQQAHLSFAIRGAGRSYIIGPTPGRPQDTQFSFVVPFDTDLELLTQVSLYDVADLDNKSEQRDNLLVRKLRFARTDVPSAVRIAVNGLK